MSNPEELLDRCAEKSLVIFEDQIYFFNGYAYSCQDTFILFAISLKDYFRTVTFCSRLSLIAKSSSYMIPPDKIKVCPLPYYHNMVELLRRPLTYLPRIWHLVQSQLAAWDLLWLPWPDPISLMILMMLRFKCARQLGSHKTCFLVVRTNVGEAVKWRYNGLQRIAASLAVRFLEWQLRLWGRDIIIFTVGEESYKKYCRSHRHVYLITLPALSNEKLPEFRSSCSQMSKTPLRLLFVGRLEQEKGLPFLFESLMILKRQNTKVHLDVVGSGTAEKNLQALVQNLDLHEEVTFHGYIDFGESLFAYYRAADLFVLPSLSEGFPKVVIEAMTIGVPVLATRVGGTAGVVRHGENSWLVEPASALALASAITTLANNPCLTERLRQRARVDIARYTMEIQQKRMLEALASHLS